MKAGYPYLVTGTARYLQCSSNIKMLERVYMHSRLRAELCGCGIIRVVSVVREQKIICRESRAQKSCRTAVPSEGVCRGS